MKIRYFIALAAVFTAIGFGFSSGFRTAESANNLNFGAKCAPVAFQQAFEESKAVFVGEVVGEEKTGDIRVFDFKVEEYWKGADAKRVSVHAYETAKFQASFRKGEKYLIYATESEGKLRVYRCSRSRLVEFAGEDLKKLGKGKTPRK